MKNVLIHALIYTSWLMLLAPTPRAFAIEGCESSLESASSSDASGPSSEGSQSLEASAGSESFESSYSHSTSWDALLAHRFLARSGESSGESSFHSAGQSSGELSFQSSPDSSRSSSSDGSSNSISPGSRKGLRKSQRDLSQKLPLTELTGQVNGETYSYRLVVGQEPNVNDLQMDGETGDFIYVGINNMAHGYVVADGQRFDGTFRVLGLGDTGRTRATRLLDHGFVFRVKVTAEQKQRLVQVLQRKNKMDRRYSISCSGMSCAALQEAGIEGVVPEGYWQANIPQSLIRELWANKNPNIQPYLIAPKPSSLEEALSQTSCSSTYAVGAVGCINALALGLTGGAATLLLMLL